MIITSIRYGLTVQPKQFESERVDLEIVPDKGQSPEQALDEAIKFANQKLRVNGNAAPNDNGNAAPNDNGKATKAPPLAKAADTAGKGDGVPEPPFDGGEPIKKIGPKPAAKPRQTKAQKDAFGAADKELRYTLEAESLEELAERFGNLQKFAPKLDWEAAVTKVVEVYRKLNTIGANAELQQQLVAAFKAERAAIDWKKQHDGQTE